MSLTDAGAGNREAALETRVAPLHPLALQVPYLSNQPAAVPSCATLSAVAHLPTPQGVG